MEMKSMMKGATTATLRAGEGARRLRLTQMGVTHGAGTRYSCTLLIYWKSLWGLRNKHTHTYIYICELECNVQALHGEELTPVFCQYAQ